MASVTTSSKSLKREIMAIGPKGSSFMARAFSGTSVITVGYTPVFHIHTAQVACTFLELQKKLDPATGAVKEENPQFLKTGDAAIVKIQPSRPMVIEKAKEFPQLGRFAIRDMGQTVAAGICLDIEKKEQ